MYTFWKRTAAARALTHSMRRIARSALRDGPSRTRPLQSLVLMNDPTFVEAGASACAAHAVGSRADLRNVSRYAFRQLQAGAVAQELKILTELAANRDCRR